jgi:hypothetical protein
MDTTQYFSDNSYKKTCPDISWTTFVYGTEYYIFLIGLHWYEWLTLYVIHCSPARIAAVLVLSVQSLGTVLPSLEIVVTFAAEDRDFWLLPKILDQSWCLGSLLFIKYWGLAPWRQSGWDVRLTNYTHLVTRLRMSGAMPSRRLLSWLEKERLNSTFKNPHGI